MSEFNADKFFNTLINDSDTSLLNAFLESGSQPLIQNEKIINTINDISETVGEHTIKVLKNYAEETQNPNQKVMWSIIFHDAGKVYTQTFDKNGIVHYYGHQQKSAEIFDELHKTLEISDKDAEYIHDLVRWHDDSIGYKLTSKIYKEHGRSFFDDFLAMKEADILDHKQKRREKQLAELEKYKQKLENNLKKLENPENNKNKTYLIREIIKESGLQKHEIKNIQEKLNNIIKNSQHPEQDVKLFLKKYKEVRISKMRNVFLM